MPNSTVEWSSETAFLTWFYHQYKDYLYKQVWKYCQTQQDADDLAQTILEKLVDKANVLMPLRKEQHLLYIATAVENAVRSEARKKRLEVCSLDKLSNRAYNGTSVLEDLVDKREKHKQFRAVWSLVDPNTRELLERKYFLSESDEDIASAMGIKPGSVRMYLTRARRNALEILAQYKDQLE